MESESAGAMESLLQLVGRTTFPLQPPKQKPPSPVRGEFEKLLEEVEEAGNNGNNDAKGKALEAFASFILGSVPGVVVKYRNLRTETSEIDLICESLSPSAPPCLLEQGRYFLVECKHWSIPVGASVARDFIAKLHACRCKLGLLFSRNGISGSDAASDAQGEILRWYQSEGIIVLVISERDWQGIKTPKLMVEWLDKAIDAARFRFKA